MTTPAIPGVNLGAPPPGASTRAAQIAYYSAILSTLPGAYDGNDKQYVGLTWVGIYQNLAKADSTTDPKALANTVLGLYEVQAAATGVGATGNAAINTGTSISQGANAFANSVPNPGGWLTSLGGDIGSGIEAAFVSFLKDLWAVILGPLEIIAGVALAILIVAWMFKDDLASVAMLMV